MSLKWLRNSLTISQTGFIPTWKQTLSLSLIHMMTNRMQNQAVEIIHFSMKRMAYPFQYLMLYDYVQKKVRL